jgi:SAM dependent carboxyl methyltransferase
MKEGAPMPNDKAPSHGVMEGEGAYNKYAKLPAGGAALAFPLLEKAASRVELATDDQPVIVADYGSSQGKNSLVPMQLALRILRDRLGPTRPISVFHIDQPSNDFNALFEVLNTDPDSYVLSEPEVFPGAIGKSFYESVLPPHSVHLGWCSYAAVWLSRIPTLIPDHFISIRGTDAVREEFARQAAQDWRAFLSLRAKELRTGGRLIVVLPAVGDAGLTGFENIMDQANEVLREMVNDHAITAEEKKRMVLGSHPRRRSNLLDPFVEGAQFEHLIVEDFEMYELADAAWNDFERDGNKEALAAKHARFFRAVFMPSLASALTSVRAGDANALRNFGDRLEEGLKRRVAGQPRPMHSFVQVMVFTKRAA